MLDVYLDVRKGFLQPKAQTAVKRVFASAVRYFADRCFTEISRDDVIGLACHLAAQGLQRGGIQNHLHILHAGVKIFLLEYGLAIHNPFAGFHADEIWPDRSVRPVVSATMLDALRAACRYENDDIRWLLALLIDTGARVSEIAGLALTDLHQNAEVPYVEIRPNPWRGLKSPASERRIPLIGSARWAANQLVRSAKHSQIYAFARYFDGDRFKPTAKGTLGAWLFSRGLQGALSAIRRTFVDRLRLAGCPEDVRAALAGWRLASMEEEYGIGYSLATLHRWLLRIEAPLPQPKALPPDGYDRALSPYACALAVLKLVSKLAYPSVQQMVQDGSLARIDVRRGLRHALRYGSIEPIHTVPARRSPAYRSTGAALASPPASVRPRRRKRADSPGYDYRKLLLTLKTPARMETASCFIPAMAHVVEGLHFHGRRPKLARKQWNDDDGN